MTDYTIADAKRDLALIRHLLDLYLPTDAPREGLETNRLLAFIEQQAAEIERLRGEPFVSREVFAAVEKNAAKCRRNRDRWKAKAEWLAQKLADDVSRSLHYISAFETEQWDSGYWLQAAEEATK